jgi:hypothetical protein
MTIIHAYGHLNGTFEIMLALLHRQREVLRMRNDWAG